MSITFYKYQGTGNDFIIIDQRDNASRPTQQTIEAWCHRRMGIGADGLILLEPSDKAHFFMRYYNADGRESTMCGNGGRCIAAFAIELGLVDAQEIIRFEAVDGMHQARVLKEISNGFEIELQMQDVTYWRLTLQNELVVHTGSPHFVQISQDVKNIDIIHQARAIRYHEPFNEEGINVNFIERDNENLLVRTYERGVEDETLSCGTGAVASAIAAQLMMGYTPKTLQTPGGTLSVRFVFDGKRFSDVYLSGPTVKVFKGFI